MKIKIFSALYHSQLEYKVNNWLKDKNIEIVNISMTSDNIYAYQIALLYKE